MLINVGLLAFVVSILSTGQVLFKMAADRLPAHMNFRAFFNMALDWRFILAICLYAAGTILWILALKRMPLTVAYPFVALSFIATPLLASLFLDERLSIANGVGGLLIISGIAVIAKWGGAS
ncbi:EamA family transporter [Hyphobacterium sp. HN65]|uniref:EamA family transporter n=1 Tax=Hyphobacterium lacteum TaxID=3116575 RepID=A0ABU7LSG4_9PROT|nr:EamA family transporter [Hyphobacterium sp. HN65]MEE2526865.1 EamA family transporter [Hyphobacterium sp. HN65]